MYLDVDLESLIFMQIRLVFEERIDDGRSIDEVPAFLKV